MERIVAVELIDLSEAQLLLCLIFVAAAGVVSLCYRLQLEADLLKGTVRTIVQLVVIGFVLTAIFSMDSPLLVLLLYTWMIFWAARAVVARVKEKDVSYFWPTFGSMLISYMLVAVIVTGLIVQVRPWWEPRYFIPLGGMIIGNAMNAISLGLDRLFSDLRARRPELELAVSFGATYSEATEDVCRGAIRTAMIPSINSCMTVGLVSLPGMMTGQILAGVDPLVAVKYQIVVMLMIVAATAIGSVIVVRVVLRLCFTPDHLLRLR
jgi:putative ABC transport system permease protein